MVVIGVLLILLGIQQTIATVSVYFIMNETTFFWFFYALLCSIAIIAFGALVAVL